MRARTRKGNVPTRNLNSLCRKAIQEVCSCVQSFSPITPGTRSLDKQSADDIVNGTNDTFGLPFCGDVYGHDIRSCVPFDRRKIRVEELSNSCPLSHWMTLIFLPNCLDT
jgi:hypothetical protein